MCPNINSLQVSGSGSRSLLPVIPASLPDEQVEPVDNDINTTSNDDTAPLLIND